MNVIEEQIKTVCQLIWKTPIIGGESKQWIDAWNALQETLPAGSLSIIPTANLNDLNERANRAAMLEQENKALRELLIARPERDPENQVRAASECLEAVPFPFPPKPEG